MAFLEWRRFNFFDLHKNVDGGKIAEALQDTEITVAVSGNSHIVIGDVNGWVHLVSRSWNITSFKAYEITVTLAQQFPHDPYLVTIGEDEAGINPILKVWDWSRTDRHGNPACVRVCRAVPSHMRPTQATALALHDNKNLMAVGYGDGSITLFRGDVARQRSSKMRTLTESGNTAISGLAFKGPSHLFVSSRGSVLVYSLGSGSSGVERPTLLDPAPGASHPVGGCKPGCAVLAEQHFMLARNDAIYCYTTDGRGPCYALEGDKKSLDWFRSYLVITMNDDKTNKYTVAANQTHEESSSKTTHATVLDIQNKFIVFTMAFDEIEAVLTEWGSFYILMKSKEIHHLDEKDLQSKLGLLFKKNLFDVAIRIASSQHYDAEGLTAIYKQYGDHLYMKGDPKCAIEQYVKTIGRLETSYVIGKYLAARHLEPLVTYLQHLHRSRLATEDHTTLLLTCFVKLDQTDQQGKLREFINNNDNAIDFDVDIAIKVCRQVSPDDALLLARKHNRHDLFLKVLVEDKKDYQQALDHIADLEFDEADMYMKKYGHVLIQNVPEESTEFLKTLCTDYKPRNSPLVNEAMMAGVVARSSLLRAAADDYLHLFLHDSARLVAFLQHMIKADLASSPLIYNTLIEHYIHVWANIKADDKEKKECEQKIVKLLKSPDANYDKDQTLIVCQMLRFKPGIVFLYEENKLYREMLRLYMRWGDVEGALELCRRRGALCPRLWLDALWWPPPPSHLAEVLNVIANERLLPPMLVVNCLSNSATYTLGDVRKYLLNVLKTESELTVKEEKLSHKYQEETGRIKQLIDGLQHRPTIFQGSRCAACHHQLELPSVHFMCQHSYHQHCFQSFAESESECPACAPGKTSRLPTAPVSAEALHSRLDKEIDGYSVVSEYFGRGLFNKLTVITDAIKAQNPSAGPQGVTPAAETLVSKPSAAAVNKENLTYGPGAEGRLRLEEGQSKQVYTPEGSMQSAGRGSNVIPVPEGRMRLQEQRNTDARYSSSLEANLARPALPSPMHLSSERLDRLPAVHRPLAARKKENLEPTSLPGSVGSSPRASRGKNPPVASNPFEEDSDGNYDESKNPFAEAEEFDEKNPFAGGDHNKNPFD